MATSALSALTVLLGLDASEYERGLSKSERQTQQFVKNTRAAILDLAKIIGGLEIGRQVFNATKDIIAEAAALNDLSDATGSSVEALSRLNNQAKIAGTDFATLQTAIFKLSQGMAGADDETSNAAKALAFLGVSTKDPAQALQEIAVKMAGFADGLGKVALAQALFGKQGAAFLATLKDLAELQDVGATVTKKQAEEAENLEKAYRRLSVEATTFRNAILGEVVPALARMLEQMTEGIRIAGGLGNALRLFGGGLSPFENTSDSLGRLRGEIERINKALAAPGLKEGGKLDRGLRSQLDDAKRQLEFVKLQERQAIGTDPADFNTRDRIQLRKPTADFSIAKDKDRTKAIKEQTSESQRFLESLENQLQATLDLNPVEAAMVKIYELERDAKAGLNDEIRRGIIDNAEQIKFAQDLKKSEQERLRTEEDAARARERNSQALTKDIEAAQRDAQAARDGNEQLQEQLVFLRGGESALLAYTQAKLLKIAAEKEDEAFMRRNVVGQDALTDALEANAVALRDRAKLLGETASAQQFIKDTQALNDSLSQLFDDTADAFLEFANGTKSAKDAFRQFTDSVLRDLQRMALADIKNMAFGQQTGGGGIGSLAGFIASLFAAYAGGGTGGVSGVGFSGGGFGEHFAMGGISRGGVAMVGERGPELVDLPAGARVTPNHKLGKMGGVTQIFNTTVMPGASTASIAQSKKELRLAVQESWRNQ